MTNKDQKGANRAELIIIRGFPATVFCSAGMRLDEQEATRAILLSSEVTEEKIREGVRLQALRSANGVEFDAQLEAQPERIALKNRILAIKREHVDDIIVPGPDEIVQRFSERFKKLKPRHMRDMGHLMKLIKAVALLNVWFRRQPDGTIIASQADIDQAFELWGRFIETQDWNVPPAVMEFYKACVLPAYRIKSEQHDYRDDIESGAIGITASELSDYSFRVHGIRPNNEVLRKQMLPQLESVGLITIGKPAKGKSDGRSRHIWPTWFPESKDPKNQNNVGTDGGVDTRNW